MGLNLQDVAAETNTGLILGPGTNQVQPVPASANQATSALANCKNANIRLIRCPTSGDGMITAPTVGASVEIMTPRLAGGWGQPRLFGHFGAEAAFSTRLIASVEGSYSNPLERPTRPPPRNDPIAPYFEAAIKGQGTEASVELGTLMLRAGAGVAFVVETPWRAIRVKPSLEYIRQTIETSGAINRAVQRNAGQTINPFADPDPRYIQFRTAKDSTMHGIGPGLELETDAGRIRSVLFSVFAGASAYYFLGDLDVEAIASNEYGETATFRFEPDRWAYRIQAGLRFRWQPE